MLYQIVDTLGSIVLRVCNQIGSAVIFLVRSVRTCSAWKRTTWNTMMQQMHFIGVRSLTIVLLTGLFSGLALALQCYIGFSRLGGEHFIGLVVAIGLTRELAPVLTGLMTTGRAGSAMAAELGSMRISEQIDALHTLRIDPMHYLVLPRIIASTIILPFLTIFAMFAGMIGAYLLCTGMLGIGQETFMSVIEEGVYMSDICGGLCKSACFGLLVSWVSCYNGYYTQGGARGVGIATTETVVTGAILVLIANYILSMIMFQTGLG